MNDPGSSIGKTLIFVGVGIAILGALVLTGSKLGLGKLPGDLVLRGKNTTVYLPLMTSIVLSVVLTLLLRLFRK